MPTSASEMFYIGAHGERADANIHNAILGDKGAHPTGVDVARKCGLTPREIALLYPNMVHDDWNEEDHPRDKEGKFALSGEHSEPKQPSITQAEGEHIKQEAANIGVKAEYYPSKYPGESHMFIVPNEHAEKFKEHISGYEHNAMSEGMATYFHLPNDDKSAAPSMSSAAPLSMLSLTKLEGKKGSNPGGVYEDSNKQKYYIKSMDEAHAKNELLAAKLYQLAGSPTMDYVPVKPDGTTHYVGTKLQDLNKNNISQFTGYEKDQAQQQFATHAWLANWDAAGTGGDNQVVDKLGNVKTVDVGGALEYRAQGTPKGAAFGDQVNEFETLRKSDDNPDAKKLFGPMSDATIKASVNKVKAISDTDIFDTVLDNGGTTALASKLIARKHDLVNRANSLGVAAPVPVAPVAPVASPPVAPTEHPSKKYLSEVKANGPERKAWREQLKSYSIKPGDKKEIQAKIIASFWKQYMQKNQTEKMAARLDKYSKLYGMENPIAPQSSAQHTAAATAAAKTIFTPASALSTAAPSTATQAELEKAKKTQPLSLQYVPGAPSGNAEAQKLVDKFNEKYSGKALEGDALHAKVKDFKDLTAAMVPLQNAAQKTAAEAQAKATAEATAKAAETKAKQEATLNDPEVKAQWDVIKALYGGSSHYSAGIDKVIQQHNLNITVPQGAMIRAYVGSAYNVLNDQLRDNNLTIDQAKYAQGLDDAMKKMPIYEGNVERGINSDPGFKIFANYQKQVGKVVMEHQFTSAGVHHKLWGKTTIHIQSKRARDIRAFNSSEGGGEVVFRPHTKLHVIKVNASTHEVWAEEI